MLIATKKKIKMIFKYILKKLYFFRAYQYLDNFFKRKVVRKKTRFIGWDMITASQPPWQSYVHNNSQVFKKDEAFNKIQSDLENNLLTGEFRLSQFPINPIEKTRELMWRHYIVVQSLNLAIKNNNSSNVNLVECGVCDGLTAYFVLNNLINKKKSFLIYLYDSWSTMKDNYLTESELHRSGKYNYLNIENTKRNLILFKENILWNQGYIPDVFSSAENPKSVNWLHIDLNSAIPTRDSLNFFSKKMLSGSVLLFDDYSWPGHEDARYEIDKWAKENNGLLISFPTGQAMCIVE